MRCGEEGEEGECSAAWRVRRGCAGVGEEGMRESARLRGGRVGWLRVSGEVMVVLVGVVGEGFAWGTRCKGITTVCLGGCGLSLAWWCGVGTGSSGSSGGWQGEGGVLGALLDGGVCFLCWAGGVHAMSVGDFFSNALAVGADGGVTRSNGMEGGDVLAIASRSRSSLILTRLC